ncbi:VasL domain-containing protein [Yersinia enterocolitica]
MSSIMHLLSMSDIDINISDPRKHSDFLILSHTIKDYKNHSNDGTYWLTIEKRCLSLINMLGYDLQTGVWLCLIETNIHGWDGLAYSSLLFSRFFAKENPSCWPPADSGYMRSQIIEWYSNNVIPAVSNLDRNDLHIPSRTAIIESLGILLQQQVVLQSGKYSEFNLLLRELEKKKNPKKYFSSIAGKNDGYPKDKVNENIIKGDFGRRALKQNKKYNFTMYTIFFIAGVTIAYGVNYLNTPEIAWKLEKEFPGNIISSYILDGLDCDYNNDPWIKLKSRMDNFEYRINSVESNGGFLTISEIKTIIYQMQRDMLQSEQPILTQINNIQNKMVRGERPNSVDLKVADNNVKKLNCRLARIHAELND